MGKASFRFENGAPIRSVKHFLGELERLGGKGDYRFYFRGHGEAVDALVPSVGRMHYYLGQAITFDERAERRLLAQFRRHTYSHFGRVASPWEALFLARHYGMPTRLLDWTANPLVALYFAAFYENETVYTTEEQRGTARLNCDGTLWAIQQRTRIDELDVFDDRRSPLSIPGIKLVYPFNPTPRMTAQSGIFTLHGDPWTDMVRCAGCPYPAKDLDVSRLVKWQIKSRHKTGIILELERLAINSRTLFPDLEGLARGLWQTEIIRKCFEKAR